MQSRWLRVPIAVWILIGVLVLLRLALPFIGLHVTNWALANKLGEHEGRIDDFDLALYRGAYQLENLVIKKKNSDAPPLLSIEDIDFSLAWRALWRGEISADVTLNKAIINAVDSDKKGERQIGQGEKDWRGVFDVIVPLHIETLDVKRSAIYFTQKDFSPNAPVRLEHIDLVTKDLRSRTDGKSLSAFQFSAILQEHADVNIKGKVDVLAKKPRADVDFSITHFYPKTVNAMLLAYLPLDLTSGELNVYGEASTSKGDAKGYVKVFMKDLDVIESKQKFITFKHFGYEILVAFGNWLFKNRDSQTLATQIPFESRQGKFDVDASEAFWSTVKNFREKLPTGFDNSISIESVEKN